MDFPAVVERRELALRVHPDADPDELSFLIRVRPCLQATAVVLNYPGFQGSFDGGHGRYARMAEELQARGVAVVRLENKPTLAFDYNQQLTADLRSAVAWVREHSSEICFAPDPDLYLIGTSLGGTACAAVASELSVRKLLLFAPAERLEEEVAASLASFSGELYVVVGERDAVTGVETVDWLRRLAPRARFHSCLLPDCDHDFSGQEQQIWEIPLEVLFEHEPPERPEAEPAHRPQSP
jgi:alpha/beta superfamily hydrolase